MIHRFLKAWIHLIFPPLCAHCSKPCETQFLCPDCWVECRPLDPLGRCQHCFEEVEEEGLCFRCIKRADFFFKRASVFERKGAPFYLGTSYPEEMAGFMMLQWLALEWPFPDLILAFPDRVSRLIGKQMASWLGVAYGSPFKVWSQNLIPDVLPEEATLLMIDVGLPVEALKRYEKQIAEAFPKKCFLLSLFPYALADFGTDSSRRRVL